MPLPISLLFLTTTKGHFDRRDIFARTLQDWSDKGFLKLFPEKLAHIKIDNVEREFDFLNEMRWKIEGFGFQVGHTEKPWKHFSEQHFLGIVDDLNELASYVSQPFCLILEDDWMLRPSDYCLEHLLDQAAHTLERDKQKICVRIPRHQDDENHFPGTIDAGPQFTTQGHLYSNNPNVISTRYLYAATTLARKNPDLIRANCEVGLTNIFKNFTHDEKPFLAFRPEIIRALHIGTKSIEEEDQL